MLKPALRPYLLVKGEDSKFRITVRTTRRNSQGYPLVSSTVLDEQFATATAAKAYIREQYHAEASDIAMK